MNEYSCQIIPTHTQCIARKLSQYTDPFNQFTISDTTQKSTHYSTEHDRFLLYCISQLGYGSWDAIRQEIQRCKQFRFDWFFRTQSSSDIQRRCDSLIRMIEKEEEMYMRRVERRKQIDDYQDDSETQKNEKVKRREKS